MLIGSYVRFVRLTSRVVADPPDFWEAAQKDHWPAIAVSWHGQSNLAYVVMPDPSQVALLISMHPDGMMMGEMARSLGYQIVEGSGASERQTHGTGGLTAFRNMLKVLKSGTTLFATADIPPEPGRNVSLGMIALARRTGRPIYADRYGDLAAQNPRARLGQDAAQLPVLDDRFRVRRSDLHDGPGGERYEPMPPIWRRGSTACWRRRSRWRTEKLPSKPSIQRRSSSRRRARRCGSRPIAARRSTFRRVGKKPGKRGSDCRRIGGDDLAGIAEEPALLLDARLPVVVRLEGDRRPAKPDGLYRGGARLRQDQVGTIQRIPKRCARYDCDVESVPPQPAVGERQPGCAGKVFSTQRCGDRTKRSGRSSPGKRANAATCSEKFSGACARLPGSMVTARAAVRGSDRPVRGTVSIITLPGARALMPAAFNASASDWARQNTVRAVRRSIHLSTPR